MPKPTKSPKKYHPKGFDIIYEDRDVIVGDKTCGMLTVSALWNKDDTVHAGLNRYVRKGNSKSRQCVYVVHRLDQDTSGVLIFAKSEKAQVFLKDNWKTTVKTYYAVVNGRLSTKKGTISSYLIEDDEYVMHATTEEGKGKLAQTAYEVVEETEDYSLIKINLLTGKKNQIRVHMADSGHPVVGDSKYGQSNSKHPRMALHSGAIAFDHPFNGKRMTFESPLPEFFHRLMKRSV